MRPDRRQWPIRGIEQHQGGGHDAHANRLHAQLRARGLACRLDRTLSQRALGNLLTNALTHTPGGGRVIVSASSGPDGLIVAVSDTGVGILPEHLPRLFDRFYRPDSARSSGEGVGLGLAIVKSIAELHGGRASITSRPGAGCVVTLNFPAAQNDEIVISV